MSLTIVADLFRHVWTAGGEPCAIAPRDNRKQRMTKCGPDCTVPGSAEPKLSGSRRRPTRPGHERRPLARRCDICPSLIRKIIFAAATADYIRRARRFIATDDGGDGDRSIRRRRRRRAADHWKKSTECADTAAATAASCTGVGRRKSALNRQRYAGRAAIVENGNR